MDYDLIILGAGPAGMTAGVYAGRKMMNTLVITQDVGGQMLWTKDVENYMGFRYIPAQELIAKFNEQVEQFSNIELSLADPAQRVEKIDGGFKVITRNGVEYTSYTVIVATGKKPRRLGVPGEEKLTGRGVAYCSTCDAPLFAGKNVAVAGGGNSAIEAVIELMALAKKVIVVNITPDWQADAILLNRVRESKNVEMISAHRVTEILGENKVEGVTIEPVSGGSPQNLQADGIFIEVGLSPNAKPVANLLELTPQGEIPVDCACRTAVEGLFAAGDVTTVPEKQIIISAGEGAKAALSAYRFWARRK